MLPALNRLAAALRGESAEQADRLRAARDCLASVGVQVYLARPYGQSGDYLLPEQGVIFEACPQEEDALLPGKAVLLREAPTLRDLVDGAGDAKLWLMLAPEPGMQGALLWASRGNGLASQEFLELAGDLIFSALERRQAESEPLPHLTSQPTQNYGLEAAGWASNLPARKLMGIDAEERAEALTVLHEASLKITAAKDPQMLLETIVAQGKRLLKAQAGVLGLVNRQENVIELAVQDPEICLLRETCFEMGRGVQGFVAAQGKGEYIADLRQWDQPVHLCEACLSYRSILAAPLICQGEVVGVLELLADGEQRAFAQADLDLLTLFANQAAVALENSRLLEAQKRQLLLARTLQELGALLTSRLSLQEALESILDLLGRVVEYDSVTIQLIQSDGSLDLGAGRGFDDIEQARWVVRKFSKQLMARDWSNRKVIVIEDTLNHPNWSTIGNNKIRSWIGAALTVKGKFIGTLNVDRFKPNQYDQELAETVLAFANQAAIAIENARLFEAERQSRERAEALREAAEMISSSLSLAEMLSAVLEQLAKVLPYDSGNVMLIDEDKLRIAASRGYEPFGREEIGQLEIMEWKANLVWRAMVESGQVAMIPNTREDDRWVDTSFSGSIRSWMGVPLTIRDRVIGLFNLDRREATPFTAEEIRLALAFASHTAMAVEKAWLFEAEELRVRQLEGLRQAALSVTSRLELNAVLDTILETTLDLLPGLQTAHIFLYNGQGGGQLQFGAALWTDGRRSQPVATPRREGLTYQVAKSGDILLVPDMRNHPLYHGTPIEWKGSILGLPLKIEDKVVGVMNVAHNKTGAFNEEMISFLRLIGDQAAIAIENARLYEQAATERKHLGLLYDIASELSQTLDQKEILKRAISITCQALGGLLGEAFLYLPEENRLSMQALYGRDETLLDLLEAELSQNDQPNLNHWMTEHREAVNIGDVRHDGRWRIVPGIDEDVRSVLAGPVMQGERLLGLLVLMHPACEAFSAQHLTLLQTICKQTAMALTNALRYEQVQQQLTEMTLIQSLSQTFNQQHELQVLLDEVALQLAKQLSYPLVEIFMVDGEQLDLRAHSGGERNKDCVSINVGIVGKVARLGMPVFLKDVHSDPDYLVALNSTISELAVPIFQGSRVVGVINIEVDDPDQLREENLDLLEILAGQISIALEKAVLYEQTRRYAEDLETKVTQRTAELTELYILSQEIGYQLSYEELLRLLLHRLRKAAGSELAMGWLMSSDCRTLRVESSRPLAQKALDQIRVYWWEQSGAQQSLQSLDDLQILVDVIGEGSGELSAPIEEIGSLQSAKVEVDQQPAGLLVIGSEASLPFREGQQRLLNTFANQARTAVQRLAALLTEQQERLEDLVEHLPVGVLLVDEENHLLVANPSGRALLHALRGADSDATLAEMGAYTLNGLINRPDLAEVVELVLDGPPQRVFEVTVRPVSSERRQWVLMLREVTQERENQQRIHLQERLATVGQLAAGIAHDFNNIMAAIMVYTDLLRRDYTLTGTSRERLGIIHEQVQRASSLIRQILDFSRRSVIDVSVLDILPFIKELEKLLGRVLPETIRLDLAYEPDRYLVSADPTRLQHVFMNLALNARDAMPHGGSLSFELGKSIVLPGDLAHPREVEPGEWVWIRVTDTGDGIAPEIFPHIFEPFFTTKPVGQGTGLGLAQAYGIIKQHEGHIEVDSAPGQGSSFLIYLPALPVPENEYAESSMDMMVSGSGEMILVVEDDGITREAMQTLLEVQNYQVLTALNGQEALKIYEEHAEKISLVVSDVVMPVMGGVAMYQELKNQWPEIKILFVTGHPLQEENQALLEAGSVRWLQKPFSAPDFSQAVFAMLDER